MSAPLLELDKLVKNYPLPRENLWTAPRQVTALAGVNLSVSAGRSFGLVGESGSGKSTLARLAMALEAPSSGIVRFEGTDVASLSAEGLKRLRRDFQMVFQDPYGSLDPRRTVGWIVAEPLWTQSLNRAERQSAVTEVLGSVGLRSADAAKYPHEFSGGQRQRIAIARALITKPRLIVADEPVSALDVSVQAQVLNLLEDLQRDFGLTFLLISHDLAVVDHVCDLVAVMYRGRIVEEGAPGDLFRSPAHPYTRALIAAIPKLISRRGRSFADGANRNPVATSGTDRGCAYADRCPHVRERCRVEAPQLRQVDGARRAACHFAEEVVELPSPA
ncbi:MAG: ATP-binding cassette domain-containing protein [Hyphomicrobiales bacterium]|nr:ATP-binding cassette domain-containing protein [Hyphomicrobiales bacterium]